jgi:hypothetical protein
LNHWLDLGLILNIIEIELFARFWYHINNNHNNEPNIITPAIDAPEAPVFFNAICCATALFDKASEENI